MNIKLASGVWSKLAGGIDPELERCESREQVLLFAERERQELGRSLRHIYRQIGRPAPSFAPGAFSNEQVTPKLVRQYAAIVANSFEGHEGRPGHRGGSLPKNAPGASEGSKPTESQSESGNAAKGTPGAKAGHPTESPEFKKWFGNSYVVDKHDRPLVVYHGTTREFSEFDSSKSGTDHDFGYAGKGHYFIDDPEWASAYATESGKPGAHVKPVYLKMEHPKVIDQYSDLLEHKDKLHIPSKEEAEGIQKKLRADGFDGIIVTGAPSEYVVFEPTQIKSIFNRGAWSATDPNLSNEFDEEKHPRDKDGKFAIFGSRIGENSIDSEKLKGMTRVLHVSEKGTPEGLAEDKLEPVQSEHAVTKGKLKGQVQYRTTLGDKKFAGKISPPFPSPAKGERLLHMVSRDEKDREGQLVYDRTEHVVWRKGPADRSWIERHYGSLVMPDGSALPDHLNPDKGAPKSIPGGWMTHKPIYVSVDPGAKLAAIGFNSSGIETPIYSAAHEARRDAAKEATTRELLPQWGKIYQQNERNRTSKDKLDRERADAMKLIMHCGTRSGSGGSADSFGCHQLEGRHLVIDPDGGVRLFYAGKKQDERDKSTWTNVKLEDPDLVKMMIGRQKDLKGDPHGLLFDTPKKSGNGSLSEYAHHLGTGGFKTKDFRMGYATKTADEQIKQLGLNGPNKPKDEPEFHAAMEKVLNHCAKRLGHQDPGSTAHASYVQRFVWNQIKPAGVEIPDVLPFTDYKKKK